MAKEVTKLIFQYIEETDLRQLNRKYDNSRVNAPLYDQIKTQIMCNNQKELYVKIIKERDYVKITKMHAEEMNDIYKPYILKYSDENYLLISQRVTNLLDEAKSLDIKSVIGTGYCYTTDLTLIFSWKHWT